MPVNLGNALKFVGNSANGGGQGGDDTQTLNKLIAEFQKASPDKDTVEDLVPQVNGVSDSDWDNWTTATNKAEIVNLLQAISQLNFGSDDGNGQEVTNKT